MGQFCAAVGEPSKDHQGQASVLLHANHQLQKILFKDPEVPLAVELVLWPWRLQEQAHGVSVRAPSLWGAQSGLGQRPRQLDDVELDSSSKAEAARWVRASSKPTANQHPNARHVSSKTAFLVGTAVPPRHLKIFCCQWEMGPRETTREKKIVLSDVYLCCQKHAFNGCFEKWVQTYNFANPLKGNWVRNPS